MVVVPTAAHLEPRLIVPSCRGDTKMPERGERRLYRARGELGSAIGAGGMVGGDRWWLEQVNERSTKNFPSFN